MLTASKLINHLDYSAPSQQPRRPWFSWYALIVSGILCVAVLIVVMLMIPLAHAMYVDFGLEGSGISSGLMIVSNWLARYHRWALVLTLPVFISLVTGLGSREPRKPQDVEAALVLAIPLGCVIVAGALLVSAVPFVRFHQLIQDQGRNSNGATSFSGFQPLFRYLAMKEMGGADPNMVAGFAAGCEIKQQYPWKMNKSELLVITPVWGPLDGQGLATLRNGKGEGNFYIVLHDLSTNQVVLAGTTSGNHYAYVVDEGPPTIIAHSSDAGSVKRTTKSVWDGNRFVNTEMLTPVADATSEAW